MNLSLNTRVKIAEAFGIKRKTSIEVFANQIKSDGYDIKDVEKAVNLKALQDYLGTSETDLTILWQYLIDKIDNRAKPIVVSTAEPIQPVVPTPTVQPIKPIKHRDRPRKIK